MTSSILAWLLAITAGLAAGGLFFGGLWWTVQRLETTDSPALLVIGSMLVRLMLAMAIFYAVMAVTGELMYLGAALVTFLIVRTVLIGRLRPKGGTRAAESR